MLRWRVYNHNGTLLGEFSTLKDAFGEANMYDMATGNAYTIEDQREDEEITWTEVA